MIGRVDGGVGEGEMGGMKGRGSCIEYMHCACVLGGSCREYMRCACVLFFFAMSLIPVGVCGMQRCTCCGERAENVE